jgi:hypothetical protein
MSFPRSLIVGAEHGLGAAAHGLGVAAHGIFHDPSIHYAGMNQYALQGIPHSGSWGEGTADMNIDLHKLSPQQLDLVRAILMTAPVNADRLTNTQMQPYILRALNPQLARLAL